MKPNLATALLALALVVPVDTLAQTTRPAEATSTQPATAPAAAAAPKTVRVAASERYRAGRVYRFFMGGGYRDLWQAKIELPVLDLARTGGGLAPTRRYGGLQSAVLGFKGADGRAYSFRGTDKDPSAILDPMLRETALRDIVQDQMAAQHPGGPLVAGGLSEAAGVLTIHERMVVMPDDPALGKFRKEFAGMVGSFFEYPLPAARGRPGFHGATAIIDHKELYRRLSHGYADRVDARAFLRARLLDLLIGDFDRHRKQWRWARLPGDRRWQPIPEDRDQAFVRYDGVGQRLAYVFVPILQCYGPDYPRMEGLTLHGWEQDRWLLTGLDWDDWKAVIRDMRARLSDAVIDAALRRLPPEYAALDGARLRKDIRGRRDRLLEGGRAFYEHLAGEVDVQGTDEAEVVKATWSNDGTLRVELRERAAGPASAPVFARTFDPGETKELRIYLRGGDDLLTVRGPPGEIKLRVIADGGQKVLDDSQSGGAIFYDAGRSSRVRAGAATQVIHDSYTPPKTNSGFLDVEDIPPRDWGWDIYPFPELGYERDVGLLIGLGAYILEYGFRSHPWARRHKLTAAFGTNSLLPTVEYSGRFRVENSPMQTMLDVMYSGNEILRFHGPGNESPDDAGDKFYRVVNHQVLFSPGVAWSLFGHRLRLSTGVWLGYSRTKEGDRLIDQLQPYGSGSFLYTGASVRVVLDFRRSVWADAPLVLPIHENPAEGYATSGVLVDLRADVSPPVGDVEQVWGSVEGFVAGYLGLLGRGRLVLSARVGGEWTWGKVPYFGAAFLGGGGMFSGGATARGFTIQRFAGDASVYGNADLRLFLVRFNLLVPCDLGLEGFADVGRVFVGGESSSAWHPSGGGGFWLAPLARTNTFSFSVAASREGALFYMRAGFHY
jgi:hypothetical protein